MIKVSVMYPHGEGKHFDHAYYLDKHMPILIAQMGDRCSSITVEKGLAGGRPGSTPPYVAACHLVCDSVEAFQAGFGPVAKELMADTPNYTDIVPVMQISEIVRG